MIEFLSNLFLGIREALKLNPRVFELVAQSPDSTGIILLIAILGGASLLAGQSVVLFINRVRPFRFALSLLLNGILFASTLFIWALAIWITGQVLFPSAVPFQTAAKMIGLGATPYLFGFMVLIPYFGTGLHRILNVWSLLIVVSGISYLTGGNLRAAIISVGVGWLVVTILAATIGKPIFNLRRRLFRTVASTDLDLSVSDIVEDILALDGELKAKSDGGIS